MRVGLRCAAAWAWLVAAQGADTLQCASSGGFVCPEGSVATRQCPRDFGDCACEDDAALRTTSQCCSQVVACPEFSEPWLVPSGRCPTKARHCKCVDGFKRRTSARRARKHGLCKLATQNKIRLQGHFKGSDSSCIALGNNGPKEGRINIVIVPSGFRNNADKYLSTAWRIYKGIISYDVLDASKIDQLNIWMAVPDQKSAAVCDYGCFGIDRLLCCDHIELQAIASETCGSGFTTRVLAIHDNEKYGGAGGIYASVSSHALAPQIAAHEFGHSIFNLGDEYVSGSATSDSRPNCEDRKCERWKDLIRKDKASCIQGCANGAYYISEKSIMHSLDLPFGLSNERFACCEYLAVNPDSLPPLCEKFSNLRKKCQSKLFRNLKAPEKRLINSPLRVTAKLVDDVWTVVSKQELEPGSFPDLFVLGDGTGEPDVPQIRITASSEVTNKTFLFMAKDRIEIPLTPDSKMDLTSPIERAGWADIDRQTLQFILDTKGADGKWTFSFESFGA